MCIVSNTGGVGALTTDRADVQGMVVASTSDELGAALRAAVPGAVDVRNPVDLGADVTPAELTAALRDVLEAGEADAVLVLLVANRLTDRDALFAAVARARPAGADVPLLLVTPGAAFDAARGLPGVTVYRTTDAAIGALGRAMRYAAWRRVPADQPEVELGTRGVHARTWVRSRLAARRGEPEWLAPSAQAELLAPYGIHLVGRLAAGPDEAEAVAAEIGYPVAVKVADPTVLHKSDRGLVRIDVRTGSDVADAVRRFADELGHDRVDVLVQPLVLGHVVSVGLVHDPQLGPLVRVAGGAADRPAAGPTRCCCCRPSRRPTPPAPCARCGSGRSWSATTAWRRSTSPRSRRWWCPWAGWPSTCPTSRTSRSSPWSSTRTASSAST